MTEASSEAQQAPLQFRVRPELAAFLRDASDEDLLAFVDMYDEENTKTPEATESYIWACLFLIQREISSSHLESAVRRATDWVADSLNNEQEVHRRASIRSFLMQGLGMIAIESFEKFKKTRSIDDLDEAINKATSALNAAQEPLEAPQEYQILSREDSILECLASALCQRYEETASLEDLNKGIEHMWALVDPERTPDPPPGRFANLANALGTRYQRSNALQDLEKAIEFLETAIEFGPEDPLMPEWLNALGHWRGQRLQRKGEKKDFDEATKTIREAMRILPDNHHLPEVLGNLGAWLTGGSREEDVNEAVELTERALAATPEGDYRRAGQLFKHSDALFSRFKFHLQNEINQLEQLDEESVPRREDGSIMINLNLHDLNSAIGFMAQAIGDFSSDYPQEADRMLKMGEMLRLRHACSAKVYAEERSEAFVAFSLVWDWRSYNATEFRCIRAAMEAADILTADARWKEASDLLQEAVEFLPTVSPRSLSHADKQHTLTQFSSLSSKAAAAMLNANKAPWEALQILELGRGVIAGLLMDMRWDVSHLSKEWPHLADQFKSLCNELDSLTEIPPSAMSSDGKHWEVDSRKRREADERFGELIKSIRSKPGFHDFLLPPTEQDLMHAASQGPIIVVNVDKHRCDAFIIESRHIRIVKLPDLRQEDVQQHANTFQTGSYTKRLLEWLWDAIVWPILGELDLPIPAHDAPYHSWPRVWWVPTGMLSQLPLHAAGYHEPGSNRTVLDRVISSYASSIKTIRHARGNTRSTVGTRAILVGMENTPHPSRNLSLPYAEREVEMLRELCPRLNLEPVKPALNKDAVLSNLKGCKVFHFAGHGESHPTDPSRSMLLLEDWQSNPMTVGDLRDRRLQDDPPFLGFLSACSTGANHVEQLADEGIHLISAFQLAGFRHVVGTLVPVADQHCVDVARVLYQTILEEKQTDSSVCQGLHRAARKLRFGRIGVSNHARGAHLVVPGKFTFSWIPFVHFGV